jgi:hypothetical protein
MTTEHTSEAYMDESSNNGLSRQYIENMVILVVCFGCLQIDL